MRPGARPHSSPHLRRPLDEAGSTSTREGRTVRTGEFREDLYHRLAVFPIRLPPLRERQNDLLPIAEALLARISAELGRPPLRLDAEAARRIRSGDWPGNVREPGNVLERAVILSDGAVIRGTDIPIPTRSDRTGNSITIAELERDAILRALGEVDGNRRLAAERLGIGLRTLYKKLRRYGIDSPTAE
jgi:two-component system, NtrC family, response regulator AtoC